MDDLTISLLFGIVYSAIGMGYTVYGKKQAHWIAFFSGVGLMVAPYFTNNAIILLPVGILLMAAPFVRRH